MTWDIGLDDVAPAPIDIIRRIAKTPKCRLCRDHPPAERTLRKLMAIAADRTARVGVAYLALGANSAMPINAEWGGPTQAVQC